MILGALSACAYDTSFEDCSVRCTTDMECPEGLTCEAEGRCRTPGETEACTPALETFPSCVGLTATCGPNANEDCCSTATPIPGGTFFRSYDVAGDGMYPSMSYPATVSPFVLDRFEVTVGRFRKFVEAGRGTRANPPTAGAGERKLNGNAGQGGWDTSWNTVLAADTAALILAVKCDGSKQTWTDVPGTNEERPIGCMTWYEATAFCAWDGGYLPTEAEWNYAASGGAEQRAYPWSNPPGLMSIDCTRANYGGTSPPSTMCSQMANKVGSSPQGIGRWGQDDLGGNILEWTLDWYATYTASCNDCANLVAGSTRVLHGGTFADVASALRNGFRRSDVAPSTRFSGVGVRCARP